jgi:DNA polymerase III alpha subunit
LQQEYIAKNAYALDEIQVKEDGEEVIVAGEILRVTVKKTKKGHPFANVAIVFGQDEINVKFWQDKLYAFEHILTKGRIIVVRGDKDEWNGFISVVARDCIDIEHLDIERIMSASST